MILKIIKISRPRFWMYTAGPYLLGYLAGMSPAPGSRNLFTLQFWLPFLYFLLPANIFLYGINDLFDRDTDALNAKKDSRENRLTAADQHWLIAVLVICLLVALPIAFLFPINRWLLLLFIGLSIFYSVPPIRLKTRPFLDSYSNVLYVLPGFLAYALTAGTLPPLPILIAGLCWAAGMHAYSAIPDIEPDRRAGVRTIAVILGRQTTLLFVCTNWCIFSALTILTIGKLGALTLLYPIIPAVLILRPTWSVTRAYWWFPIINGVMGFIAFLFLAVFVG